VSTRRTKPGGWVKRERRPCRWCGGEVPRRRLTFCGEACVHEWKLRTDPGYLRAQVFARDRGVCAACGLDTEALRKEKRKLDYRARRAFEKEWGGRRNLWDADHVVPVVEGGGECDLSNMRTLCVRCHREATAALRRRRVKKSAGMAGAAEVMEGTMPGKKAHQRRNVEHAGMHGVAEKRGHGRKSVGETQGQYARDVKRRHGQYGGAGDPPLIMK
jgi:5-methylcytosine-specific restriction protein A